MIFMTDLEIARKTKGKDILLLAEELGLSREEVLCYGTTKAKIHLASPRKEKGKLILVTALNPTPYGEGKTTVSIGLADALHAMGKNAILSLREPSMGPVFGMKGGATGGGYSQVIPMEDINLHFTGDFHAITACNNLLCAAIDNHIKQGNELRLEEVTFQRCLDENDRALREVTVGLGGAVNGTPRQDQFTITAASEIMALFCLATSLNDLKEKLGNIIIGYTKEKIPRFAKELKVEGAMCVLLKDAFDPNLVQTLEHTPALIHGGPFANIAHGCSSVVATKLALGLGDYVVTEAGFGSDLGAEKFFNIKCQSAGLSPDSVVLVVTLKALKYNAGVTKEEIYIPNPSKVKEGLCNLEAHIAHLKQYGIPFVVALNEYDQDEESELNVVLDYCRQQGILVASSRAYQEGGKGAIPLAEAVLASLELKKQFTPLYQKEEDLKDKIFKICKNVYGANDIIYSDQALQKIEMLKKNHFDLLPICMAKTQYSLSDDAKKLGHPKDFSVTVRDIRLYHGAGFITVLLGDIMTMPGLPKNPNYEKIDLDENGNIVGIF